jgi:hypothetical protein
MANDFYNSTGTPVTGSFAASSPMRNQFSLIEDGFDKLPALTGNGGRPVIVNLGGSALTVTEGTLALAGDLATTGAFNTTLIQTADVSLTLPAVSGTLATLAGTETLSNKTLVGPALGTPVSGDLSNCTGTATGLTVGSTETLATPRLIYGNSFDGSANVTGIIDSSFGGTGNGFTEFSGALTPKKTYALPNLSTTIVTTGATSNVTVGYTYTSFNAGTKSTGTFTPDPASGNAQYATNNGAHTLAAPSSDCSIMILYTNGASAGVVTFSGFTVGASTGDPLTTTNTNKFLISIVRINGVASYLIKALQ